MLGKNYTEKRKHLRIKMAKPQIVKFRIKKHRKLPISLVWQKKTKIENISVGGLKMGLPVLEKKQINSIIEGKKKLVLEFIFSTLKKPVKVTGNVVWVKSKGKSYVLGVSFEGIKEKDQEVILAYMIKSCLNDGCDIN